MIKFLCKDFWTIVFRKQVDNLKTNHRVRRRYGMFSYFLVSVCLVHCVKWRHCERLLNFVCQQSACPLLHLISNHLLGRVRPPRPQLSMVSAHFLRVRCSRGKTSTTKVGGRLPSHTLWCDSRSFNPPWSNLHCTGRYEGIASM